MSTKQKNKKIKKVCIHIAGIGEKSTILPMSMPGHYGCTVCGKHLIADFDNDTDKLFEYHPYIFRA